MQSEKQAIVLEWEKDLLSLASELRGLAQDTSKYQCLHTFILHPEKASRPDRSGKEKRVVFMESSWEDGLRRVAEGLRTLAHGIFVHGNHDGGAQRRQKSIRDVRLQTSALQQRETEVRQRVGEIVGLLTTHAPKTRGRSWSSVPSQSKPIQPTTAHNETHRCGLRDIISELRSVSKKAKRELRTQQQLVLSLHQRWRRAESERNARPCKADTLLLQEQLRGSGIREPISSYSRESETCGPQEKARKSGRGETKMGDYTQRHKYHRRRHADNTPQLRRIVGSPSLQLQQSPTNQEGTLSSWACALRAVSQQVFHVTRRARIASRASDVAFRDSYEDSSVAWAAQNNGQKVLLEWELKLLRLSNEMWKVAKLLREGRGREVRTAPRNKDEDRSVRVSACPTEINRGWIYE